LWHKNHCKSNQENIALPDPETVVRPLESHRFLGPGLFEPLEKLIDRALIVKSHTLGMSKSWMINNWLPGQAGQQFVRSFMNPGM
jgi:hypothetical protein